MNQRKAPPCETSVTPRRATALAALWLLSTCYGCGGDRFEAGAHGESGGQGGAGGAAVTPPAHRAPGRDQGTFGARPPPPPTRGGRGPPPPPPPPKGTHPPPRQTPL